MMKGKKNFTSAEVCKIKELISQKLQASSDKQKGIRNRIRKIGFYWEDFHPKAGHKIEYNIENFEELIKNGNITIQD